MSTKKYVSLGKLSNFLDNLKNTFALLVHVHNLEDISDYVVDSFLSSTSTNPVQNKVIDAEFNAISEAFEIYEANLDSKASLEDIETIATSKANATDLTSHIGNTSNPHGVTYSQLGLSLETWTFTLEDGSTVTKKVVVQ